MKIAYVILAHKNANQILRLVEALNSRSNTFFIHIDKAAGKDFYEEVTGKLRNFGNLHFIKRFRSAYGSFGLVEATLEGIRTALKAAPDFDYVINLSGQDYPIKNNQQISEKLAALPYASYLWNFPMPFEGEHQEKGWVCQRLNRVEYWHIQFGNVKIRFPFKKFTGYGISNSLRLFPLWAFSKLFIPEKRSFMEGMKPYGGGQWWCLSKKHARYVVNFIENNPTFVSFYRYTNIPDEMFFQTILMNSPYQNEVENDDLRLIKFTKQSLHPITFDIKNYQQIEKSKCLFARKFDMSIDFNILDKIDITLLNKINFFSKTQ